MIKNIGTDIVELERINQKGEKFIKRILSDQEYDVYQSFNDDLRKLTYVGGRFAAKEALSKAISMSADQINFKDFVILNDKHGKPYLASGPMVLSQLNVHISISHTAQHALAVVILEIM